MPAAARVVRSQGIGEGHHAHHRTHNGRNGGLDSFYRTPPAGAVDLTDGPAQVDLTVCAQGSSQTDTFVPNCSYTFLAKKLAPSYTYLTSHGAVSWKSGSLTGNTLSFPAVGQTWPPLSGLYLGASSTTTPRDITGTIDADGRVDLTMQYEVLLQSGISQCTLTGSVALSSKGNEKLGGASGSNYNPATGAFSVVSTSYNQPAESGQCLLANAAYDLSQGMGWYLTGTLELPGAPVAQTATVKVPKTIKAKGKTVLLKQAVVTNAGQTATAKLSWSTKTKGPKKKFASVKTSKAGKVTITTTGKAKRLKVKLSLKAPAVPGYQPYSYSKKWTVK